MTTEEIFKIIEQKYKAEEEVKKIISRLTEVANSLKPNILDNCDYESAKKLYDSIKYYANDKSVVEEMSAIVETKKAEKYPVLLKPTYYPEIDTLEISDSEKLRLDKSARWNIRNYISKSNMDRLTYPLSIEDLELLRSVGVAERKYNFKCEECGCSCDVISEEKLEKYKRVWELEKLRSELTDEQDEELEKLYEDGFFNIFLACMDCDEFEKEICNEDELKEYESHIEVLYKIVKQPNLEYEKL